MSQSEEGCIRVTHPCAGRRQILLPSLPHDLHVLGLPLAFILSQDQTLRCNLDVWILSGLILKFQSVPFTSVVVYQYVQRTFYFYTFCLATLCILLVCFPFALSFPFRVTPFFGAAKVLAFFFFPNFLTLFFKLFFSSSKSALLSAKAGAKICFLFSQFQIYLKLFLSFFSRLLVSFLTL